MDFIKKLNGVKYGDYEGFASVDTYTGVEFFKLCGEKGIDTDNYFPIGFNLGEGEGIGLHDKIYLRVYLIDKSLAGSNYDEIEKFIKKNSGEINLIRKSFLINYSELTKIIKRFEITIFNRFRDIIKKVEIDEDQTEE